MPNFVGAEFDRRVPNLTDAEFNRPSSPASLAPRCYPKMFKKYLHMYYKPRPVSIIILF